MIETHDYDPQIQAVTLPLASFSDFTDFVFVDVDEDAMNDWGATQANQQLIIQAPVDNAIDWGTLYSFSFK